MTEENNNIKSRKREHLQIAASGNGRYQDLTTGFENYRLIHNALPEINFSDVKVTTKFFGYKLSCPLIINPISGGEETGGNLNLALAKVAAEQSIALSLGSLRPALENIESLESYTVVSKYTKNIPLIVNIGCLQLKESGNIKKVLDITDQLNGDAISVHLNPLQEILQPEGGSKFKGVLRAIKKLVKISDLPVIVKEVGFGLSKSVIKKLIDIDVNLIDVSGSGGTSWSRIESRRIKNSLMQKVAGEFYEWGLPTSRCLVDAGGINNLQLIASGGINSGLDFAKALALGADYAGIAGVVVNSWLRKGEVGIENIIKKYRKVLKISLFSTGCENIENFKSNPDIIEKIN